MPRKIINELVTMIFIVLWVYASLNKLMEYQTFKMQLGKSPYIAEFSGMLSWAVPLIEILIAVSLVPQKTRYIGLYASFFLMAIFTGYIYIMLHYSYYLPCSCGGIIAKMSWVQHFYFNIALTVLAAVACLFPPHQKSLPTEKNADLSII